MYLPLKEMPDHIPRIHQHLCRWALPDSNSLRPVSVGTYEVLDHPLSVTSASHRTLCNVPGNNFVALSACSNTQEM